MKVEEYSFEKLDKDFSAIATALKLTGNSKVVSVARSVAYSFLKKHLDIPRNLYKKHPKEVVEAFTHLTEKDFRANPEYYLSTLSFLYKQIKHTDTNVKTFFRKAVCLCDESLFK